MASSRVSALSPGRGATLLKFMGPVQILQLGVTPHDSDEQPGWGP